VRSKRVILITGGASGIGAETARRLLADGHNVVATGRDESRLRAFARATGGALLPVAGDAADYAAVRRAVDTALERFGRLDAVIANAGFATHDTLATGDPERWRAMVLTNVLGPALLVRAALDALKRSCGRIIFIGSVAGLKNTPGNLYSVTKWAVTGLAENTRLMVTGAGVGVTLIAPGRAETPFWDSRPEGAGDRAPEGPRLSAAAIAAAIAWVLEQPAGVDVNTIVIRPTGQTT
jgi:NADP-dependent 3-hydroxy acid dehydrogenase YdfG